MICFAQKEGLDNKKSKNRGQFIIDAKTIIYLPHITLRSMLLFEIIKKLCLYL